MPDLEKSLLATIIWFDMFEYPLTLLELAQWRMVPLSLNPLLPKEGSGEVNPLSVIQKALAESLFLQQRIAHQNGFYFLKGRETLIPIRLHRAALAHQKLKKARRAARIFAGIPFVRMIAVGNTLGWNNAREESDIDFFIVAQQGRLALVRFIAVYIAELFHWQPTKAHKQDATCLSFFVATNAFSLQSLQHPVLVGSWPYDVYLHYWIHQLTLLFDQHQAYDHFKTKNAWAEKLLPLHKGRVEVAQRGITTTSFVRLAKHCGEYLLKGSLGNRLESYYFRIQRERLPIALTSKLGQGTEVVFSPSVLKFHDQDRRKEYAELFLKKNTAALP